MANGIDIDDLREPVISEAGRKVLAERAAIPIPFSMDGILKFAEGELDVPLYRGEFFLERLESFMLEGSRACQLSDAGKGFLTATMANLVIQRSRFEHLFQQHPEIEDVELYAPIVLAGIPRSGTTNLSNIMASDSRLNSLSFWEGYRPVPSQDVLTGKVEDDSRDLYWKKGLADMTAVAPLFQNMIDIPYDGATEETTLMHMAGMPVGHQNHVYTPDWNHWFWKEMDPAVLYSFLRKAIQALQWLRGNNKRWILKSPHHLAFLPSVDRFFPGAKYVITHRDPASSMVSNMYMIAYIFRETQDRPNVDGAFGVATGMGQGMIGGLVRDIDSLNPADVEHIYFHEYMADPMGMLKRVYQRAELEWTEQAEGELKAYIDSHQRGRHGGKLMYRPERDFNRARDEIRAPYQYYLDKFPDIRVEESHG